jgi:phosphoribosylformylglycinamidine cyclo-ligase
VLEQEMRLGLDAVVPELGRTLGDELLTPTRIYASAVRALLNVLGTDLHALCHVTGGGLVGNLPRVLPTGVVARVQLDHIAPPVFRLIARGGPVDDAEMLRTFNLGIGLVAVVAREAAEHAAQALTTAGEKAWALGEVVPGTAGEPPRVEVPGP